MACLMYNTKHRETVLCMELQNACMSTFQGFMFSYSSIFQDDGVFSCVINNGWQILRPNAIS